MGIFHIQTYIIKYAWIGYLDHLKHQIIHKLQP